MCPYAYTEKYSLTYTGNPQPASTPVLQADLHKRTWTEEETNVCFA